MGCLLTWRTPPTDSDWENTEIYRSNTETGTYILQGTVAVSDTSFYDCDGQSTSWYKIRFTSTTGACTESDYSDPIQGSVRYLYANPTDVARRVGLDIDDLPKDLTYNDLYKYIADISRSIDKLTNNLYGRTETFEYRHSSKYMNISKSFDLPYRNVTDLSVFFKNSIESETFDEINYGYDYDYKPESGRIFLYRYPTLQPRMIRDIKVTGTYGQSTIPDEIRQLAEILSGIKIFVYLTGGSFDDVTAYTLGEYSESLGEPYTNLRATITMLEEEKRRLMELTGISTKKTTMRLA